MESTKTCRQHAATCFRLAIDAGDPEISMQLFAIAAQWLEQAVGEVDPPFARTPPLPLPRELKL
jgi:hypothetical protein